MDAADVESGIFWSDFYYLDILVKALTPLKCCCN
jgi:hypothetical protein